MLHHNIAPIYIARRKKGIFPAIDLCENNQYNGEEKTQETKIMQKKIHEQIQRKLTEWLHEMTQTERRGMVNVRI